MVQAARHTTAEGRDPDFLGIGVVRGGTTWLWENLRYHPDIWLSPVKEINYFNRLYPIQKFDAQGGQERRVERPALLSEKLKHLRLSRLKRYLRNSTPANLRWQWRFYSGRPSPAWYRSLFQPAGERVAGDITPHYSALDDEAVRHIASFLPEVKIVLILRDPVARDWSHAVHFLTRYGHRPLAQITEDEFRRHFHDPSTRLRGDYPRMLELWQDSFGPERFHLAFFDDIIQQPDKLMLDVYHYLGVDSDPCHLPPRLRQVVNPSSRSSIPSVMQRYLSELNLPQLEWLAGRLGGHADAWLASARGVLAGREES